jgi:uncharacterized protein YcaQ
MLLKQGLLGEHRFLGKAGVMAFVRQAGCIQYDPLDVCGKNSELVLQSRVKGFTKQMLYDLLYQDRLLVDYFDKCLAIIPVEDWPYFERIREANRHHGRGREEVDAIADDIRAIIAAQGPVSSKDIGLNEKVDWYWSSTNLSRAALETLYFRGDLVVHHKKGTIKYYALAKDHLPAEILHAGDPLQDDLEHFKWRVLRRISAVGLLWRRASDAWIYIQGMKSGERTAALAALLKEEKIVECSVQGIKESLYIVAEDRWIMEMVLRGGEWPGRTEFIAPLDSFIWDRKLIKALFGFDYTWEVYVPAAKRQYGYYVLPVLSQERFIGRTEVVCDRKNDTLIVKGLWFEPDVEVTAGLRHKVDECLERFRVFHELSTVSVRP